MVDEEVLVFSRDLLVQLGHVEGVSRDAGRYLPSLWRAENVRLVPRGEAETSQHFKQLIPYVVLRSGGDVFSYRRSPASGETRLIGRSSVGLGGHITAGDMRSGWSRGAYLAAARREVLEEVAIEPDYVEEIVGVINVESDEVGRVHFGVVHVWTLERGGVTARESQITQGRFMSVGGLLREADDLEEWSVMALKLLVPR